MGRSGRVWAAGIRAAVVTPSATTMPGGRLERAISTPSSGCRRMTGAGVMGSLLGESGVFTSPRSLRGEVGLPLAIRVRGEAPGQILSLHREDRDPSTQ